MIKFRKPAKALLALVLIGTFSLHASADTISDLEEEKRETGSKREAAEELIGTLETGRNDILTTISVMDQQVQEYTDEIAELEEKKEKIADDITTKEKELKKAKENETVQYEAMKLRIQYSYENGGENALDAIFSASNIANIVNETEYASAVFDYDSKQLRKLISIKEEVQKKEKELQEELLEVDSIEKDVLESREAMNILIEGKQAQLLEYKTQIGKYEDVVAQLQAREAEIDAEIEEIERKAREAAEAAAAAEAARTGQPVDVPVYYTGGTFQWPVSTGGVITSTFGPRWGTVHRGLDIGCPTGTPIVAGEAGTVIGAGYESSMGNYVMIDHGNGVTTVYMHNSSLCVSTGQVVGRGEVIALAGSTGDSTGPHCHFGLRINGTYVDPYPYLQ